MMSDSQNMKVLVPGVDKKKTWRLKVKCDGSGATFKNEEKGNAPCGALLEVGINDIFSAFNPYATMRYFIKCPCCNSYTELKSSTLPSYVKFVADKKNEKDYDLQVKKEKESNPNYEQDLYKKDEEKEDGDTQNDKDYIDIE